MRTSCALLIEEFGPELIYYPGVNNAIADYLSRLKYNNNSDTLGQFFLNKEDVDTYLLNYKIIMKYQQKDNKLLKKSKKNIVCSLHTFTTAGCTRTLTIKDNNIVVLLVLQEPVIYWYHEQLFHP